MSSYLDRTRRTYRQALIDRCARAIRRGVPDHTAERALARINVRQATKYRNANNKAPLVL